MNETRHAKLPKSVSPPPILSSASSLLAKVSPGAAAFVAKKIFLHVFPYKMNEEEKAFLASGTPLRLYDGSAYLHGWRWGSGPAVLTVHGWHGRGVQFHKIAGALVEKGYSVIGFDFPGHGDSKKAQPTLYDFVHSIEVINETYGPFEGVVAHSLGSLASALAFAEGAMSGRLVCVNPLSSARYALHAFSQMSGIPMNAMRSMQHGIEREYKRSFDDCDFERIAPGLNTPVLVVHDRFDRVTPFEESLGWVKLLPEGKLETTERLGHQRSLVHEIVAEKVVDFFGSAQGNMKNQFLSEYAL